MNITEFNESKIAHIIVWVLCSPVFLHAMWYYLLNGRPTAALLYC